MARPKKESTASQRDTFITIRATDDEREALRDRAKKVFGYGKGAVGEYARMVLFSDWKNPPPSARDTEAIRALSVEIRRVGNNLNQMANVAHVAKNVAAEEVLNGAIAELINALEAVQRL